MSPSASTTASHQHCGVSLGGQGPRWALTSCTREARTKKKGHLLGRVGSFPFLSSIRRPSSCRRQGGKVGQRPAK